MASETGSTSQPCGAGCQPTLSGRACLACSAWLRFCACRASSRPAKRWRVIQGCRRAAAAPRARNPVDSACPWRGLRHGPCTRSGGRRDGLCVARLAHGRLQRRLGRHRGADQHDLRLAAALARVRGAAAILTAPAAGSGHDRRQLRRVRLRNSADEDRTRVAAKILVPGPCPVCKGLGLARCAPTCRQASASSTATARTPAHSSGPAGPAAAAARCAGVPTTTCAPRSQAPSPAAAASASSITPRTCARACAAHVCLRARTGICTTAAQALNPAASLDRSA